VIRIFFIQYYMQVPLHFLLYCQKTSIGLPSRHAHAVKRRMKHDAVYPSEVSKISANLASTIGVNGKVAVPRWTYFYLR